MRFLPILFLSLIAHAQDLAPDSVSGRAFAVSFSFGVLPFASEGTATAIFSDDTWYFSETSESVSQGDVTHYTYTKTGENSGVMAVVIGRDYAKERRGSRRPRKQRTERV